MDNLNQQDEMTLLKEQAKKLGISHSPNIGLDTLRSKIEAHLNGEPEVETAVAANETAEERTRRIRNELQAEGLKLVRVRVTNMDPSKSELRGEILTVQNKYIGTVRKFVPYGEASEVGYHIPKVLYDMLKEKKFNQIKTRKGRDPREVIVEQRMVNEFAIEVLPPLTQEELANLAAAQAAKAGLQD